MDSEKEKGWSSLDESVLFEALIKNRPVGIDRNWHMAVVTKHMEKGLKGVRYSASHIWSHLKTMYNLDLLSELEDTDKRFPADFKDFSLPRNYVETLEEKSGKSFSGRRSTTDSEVERGYSKKEKDSENEPQTKKQLELEKEALLEKEKKEKEKEKKEKEKERRRERERERREKEKKERLERERIEREKVLAEAEAEEHTPMRTRRSVRATATASEQEEKATKRRRNSRASSPAPPSSHSKRKRNDR